MQKILFMIHDLCPGGAEKVLVNLVNNMNPNMFDITVLSLFDIGIHRDNLKPHIHYKYAFKNMLPGNSHVMKLFSPKFLHSIIVKEYYDIEVSYLEGPCARIISGCMNDNTKKIAWIHRTMDQESIYSIGFRSRMEANESYLRFDHIVCVSKDIESAFKQFYPGKNTVVYYNTNESYTIQRLADEKIDISLDKRPVLVSVGTLKKIKGFDRLLNISLRLKSEGIEFGLIIVGGGPLYENMKKFIEDKHLEECIWLVGNQTNPYKYVKKCDIYVCSSLSEGFSTAATEALILGTPICTVEVSGMRELLGEHNEYGIVTENSEEALYQAIKKMILDDKLRQHYRKKAMERGALFSTEITVQAVEKMFLDL